MLPDAARGQRGSGGCCPEELRLAIETFLQASKRPVLSEPGEELFVLAPGKWDVAERAAAVWLQVWDERRNLVRKITGMGRPASGKLTLQIERFGKRTGTMQLVDLGDPRHAQAPRQSARLEFREQFRRFLKRQFPRYTPRILTTEPDLEHTLSPVYPRALICSGTSAWAAIGAPENASSVEGVLTFGLIWLDLLRRQERNLVIEGLILLLPAGLAGNTLLRLRCLDPAKATYLPFLYDEHGEEWQADLRDSGNLDTRLERCQRRLPGQLDPLLDELKNIQGVDLVPVSAGNLSLRVRGFEFAKTDGSSLLYGLETKRVATASNLRDVRTIAEFLCSNRNPEMGSARNQLFWRNPESWLESQVRASLETVDAQLASGPVYGQVPAFSGLNRGVLDLLVVDRTGRLAVLELKASEDIHLPVQALDYWMRVRWHLSREEFTAYGYFPGVTLRPEAPRMLLVAPALSFHPTNERVMRFFPPELEAERIGVGSNWRHELKVMFRM